MLWLGFIVRQQGETFAYVDWMMCVCECVCVFNTLALKIVDRSRSSSTIAERAARLTPRTESHPIPRWLRAYQWYSMWWLHPLTHDATMWTTLNFFLWRMRSKLIRYMRDAPTARTKTHPFSARHSTEARSIKRNASSRRAIKNSVKTYLVKVFAQTYTKNETKSGEKWSKLYTSKRARDRRLCHRKCVFMFRYRDTFLRGLRVYYCGKYSRIVQIWRLGSQSPDIAGWC